MPCALHVGFWPGPLPAGRALVDQYLEFVAGRCRPNTLRAVAFDLKAFFTVVRKGPVEVSAVDVVDFLAISVWLSWAGLSPVMSPVRRCDGIRQLPRVRPGNPGSAAGPLPTSSVGRDPHGGTRPRRAVQPDPAAERLHLSLNPARPEPPGRS